MKARIAKRVMRKRKEGWEKSNSWHTIYLVVSVGTKPPLVHVVEELHTRVLLPGHKVSPKSTTWLTTKARHEGTRQAPLVTLMPPPLRSISTKEEGLHAPHTKCPRHSTPNRRVEDDCSEPLRPQGFRRTLYNLIHLRITSQGTHTLLSLSFKLSLALSTHTHTQACASLWMSNLALGWLVYDLLSVLHSSAIPHYPTTSNGWVEGV
jgi:hypothetical protein